MTVAVAFYLALLAFALLFVGIFYVLDRLTAGLVALGSRNEPE